MRKSRDFLCDNCGFTTIKIVEDDVHTRPCDECAFPMKRVLSAPAIGSTDNMGSWRTNGTASKATKTGQ